MELEDILNLWEKDSIIQEDKLDLESLNIPKIHHKYLKILASERLQYKQLESKRKKLSHNLWLYYTGKMPADVYKKNPLPGDLISNNKIKDYIEVDEKYTLLTNYIDASNEKIDVLLEIIKEINGRAFKIKNAIEWQKFINGTS